MTEKKHPSFTITPNGEDWICELGCYHNVDEKRCQCNCHPNLEEIFTK